MGLLGCLLVSFSTTGIEFSADNKFFRKCHALFGWRVGRWQKLPIIVGVTLKYFSKFEKTDSGDTWGIWNNTPQREEKLVVMLSVKHTAVGIILGNFSVKDVNQAGDFAHEVANRLGVPVNTYLPSAQFKPL